MTPRTSSRLAFATMALAGVNLSIVQYVALTEFPSMLGSNELVVLLVLCAYFLGLSGGYLASGSLSRGRLLMLGAATLALHATLPFSSRWVAGSLWRINLAGNIPPFIFFIVLLGITPFYAVFLPRLVDSFQSDGLAGKAGGGGGLVPLYATELAGSIIGLALAVVLTPARIRYLLAIHLAGIVGLILLAAWERRRWLVPLLAGLPILYFSAFPALDQQSLEYFYLHRRGAREVRLVASEFSPYQRVDIIASRRPKGGEATFLYLNGNLFYGINDGAWINHHNLFVSILPNLLLPRPSQALVVGGGSLDSVRYLASRTASLDIVEIDKTVTTLARRHLQEPRGGFPGNWSLHIDDGKHFLANWQGKPFDVISIDVPIPSFLQTAMLHSDRFFALAKTRLATDGIFAISLSGEYLEQDTADRLAAHLGQRIMAGLYRNFKHVQVVQGDGRAYAWASDFPFSYDSSRIETHLHEFLEESGTREVFGVPEISVMADDEARRIAEGFQPIGEADMQIVLKLSIGKLVERFYGRPR